MRPRAAHCASSECIHPHKHSSTQICIYLCIYAYIYVSIYAYIDIYILGAHQQHNTRAQNIDTYTRAHTHPYI